jgi:hypothetical protein
LPALPDRFQPYAKAVVPFVLTIIAVVGQWAATGELDRAELVTAVTGALSALVTFAVPNGAAVHDHYDRDDSPDADGTTTLGAPSD